MKDVIIINNKTYTVVKQNDLKKMFTEMSKGVYFGNRSFRKSQSTAKTLLEKEILENFFKE